MIDNTARYKHFKENEADVWKSRFGWHGEDGEASYPNCNIVIFLKDTNIDFNQILKSECPKISDVFKKISQLGEEYAEWAFVKNKNFVDLYLPNDERIEGIKISLKNHFVGSLGEFFFCFMLNDRKEFMLPYNVGDNAKTAFNFSNISPRLTSENDFGVDLTGDIEYIDKKNPCAIQVKFWNPNLNKKNTKSTIKKQLFTNEMASGVYTDAILNNFIDNESDKSIIVCWTLGEENISKWLRKNVLLLSKMTFLDMSVLHNKVDKKSPEFWYLLKNKFNDIKNY